MNRCTVTLLFAGLLLAASLSATAAAPSRPLSTIMGIALGSDLESVRRQLQGKGERGGRDTRSGGVKEGWKLTDSEYNYIAYQTDRQNRIKWISGFYRDEDAVPFASLGDPGTADRLTHNQVIWNVADADGGYRLVAKGTGQKATVVYLLSLE